MCVVSVVRIADLVGFLNVIASQWRYPRGTSEGGWVGVARLWFGGCGVWSGLKCFMVPSAEKAVWEEEKGGSRKNGAEGEEEGE